MIALRVSLTVAAESEQNVTDVAASEQQNVGLFLGRGALALSRSIADGVEVKKEPGVPWGEHGYGQAGAISGCGCCVSSVEVGNET